MTIRQHILAESIYYATATNTTERLSWKLCHIPERDAKQVETMKV